MNPDGQLPASGPLCPAPTTVSPFLPIFLPDLSNPCVLPELGCSVCVCVCGWGPWGLTGGMTQAKLTDPPCGCPREQVGPAGLMGSGSPAPQALREWRSPAHIPMVTGLGKAGSGGIAMAPVWPTAPLGAVLARSGSGLPPGRSPPTPGSLWPGEPGGRPSVPGQPLGRPEASSASQPSGQGSAGGGEGVDDRGNECLAHQLAQRRPDSESWPSPAVPSPDPFCSPFLGRHRAHPEPSPNAASALPLGPAEILILTLTPALVF